MDTAFCKVDAVKFPIRFYFDPKFGHFFVVKKNYFEHQAQFTHKFSVLQFTPEVLAYL